MSKFVIAVAFALIVAVHAYSGIRVSKVPSFRWDQFLGKTVLVTGGSSGIGFGIALNFARFGARVVICSRDSNPAWFNGTDAARRINADPDVQSLGGYARWVKTDVAVPEQVDALIKNITDVEGTIDFVASNAGVAGFIGILEDEKLDSLFDGPHDCIRVNLFGMAIVNAAVVKYWTSHSRGGVIVNTASIDGLHGEGEAPLYCASKHGVIGLTKSIAVELASLKPPIRVNAIAPGFTDTSLVWQQCKYMEYGQQSWEGDYITHDHPLWKKYEKSFADAAPSGKICDPMDQAHMVMYLCSEEASYISGAVLIVDGGINDEDLDDDVHIVSGGNVSDVEVMMQINGNENQDVFIVDVYNDNIDDSFSDVIDASQNQVDISTQVDYVDPNTIDGGEGVTGDDLFFA